MKFLSMSCEEPAVSVLLSLKIVHSTIDGNSVEPGACTPMTIDLCGTR